MNSRLVALTIVIAALGAPALSIRAFGQSCSDCPTTPQNFEVSVSCDPVSFGWSTDCRVDQYNLSWAYEGQPWQSLATDVYSPYPVTPLPEWSGRTVDFMLEGFKLPCSIVFTTKRVTFPMLPFEPSQLTATALSDGTIHLVWPVERPDPPPSDIYVNLYRDQETQSFGNDAYWKGEFFFTETSCGGPHTYSIRTYIIPDTNCLSTKATSNSVMSQRVTAPSNLTVANNGMLVNLSWSNVPGETGYVVYRGNDEQSAVPIGQTTIDETTFRDDEAPLAAQTYCVEAVNCGGTSLTKVCEPRPAPTAPAAPDPVTAVMSGCDVTLTWTNVGGEDGYRVYRGPDAESLELLGQTDPDVTTWLDPQTPGTALTYCVLAFNPIGSSSMACGERPAPTVAIAPPASVSATDGTGFAVNISWNPVPGALGYRIYRDLAPVPIGDVRDMTSFVDGGAAPGTYTYCVTAYLSCAESERTACDEGVMPEDLRPRWVRITDRQTPLRDHSAIYDPNSRRMVVFGGYDSQYGPTGGYTNELWTLDMASPTHAWTLWPGARSCDPFYPGYPLYPTPRSRAALVYDGNCAWNGPPDFARGMIAYGGTGPNLTIPCWNLDLNFPAKGDPMWCIGQGGLNQGTFDIRAIYDSRRSRMVAISPHQGLFAMSLLSCEVSGTWNQIWSGDMVGAEVIGPVGYQVVYDPEGDRLVAYGGWRYTGWGHSEYIYDKVYVFPLANPSGWTLFATGGPGALADASLSYDESSKRVFLYGGERGYRTGGGTYTNSDVWTLPMTGTIAWSKLTVQGSAPQGRFRHSGIIGDDRLIIFGGTSNATSGRNDTWYLQFPDYTPPAAITGLYVDMVGETSAGLVWAAPGDDGNVGTASAYDVRYSELAIMNDADFSRASQFTSVPAPGPPGTNQGAVTNRLRKCTRYWFAIKTQDEAGNWSPLSNVVSVKTRGTGPGCTTGGFSADAATEEARSSLFVEVAGRDLALVSLTLDGDPASGDFDLSVYDVAGRLRRRFDPMEAVAGGGQMAWDLRDDQGLRLPAGIYFVRLQSAREAITKRIVMLH